MKNIRLKSLISVSFLIFLLPFLQTCSDKSLKTSPKYTGQTIDFNGTPVEDTRQEIKEKEVWLEEARKESTFNVYFLGFSNLDKFSVEDLTDKQFYIFSSFTIVVLLTFLMLILSFRQKFKQILILSSLNLFLLALATISLCIIELIEDYKQIKIGYYLFVINSLLIILESRKEINKNYR